MKLLGWLLVILVVIGVVRALSKKKTSIDTKDAALPDVKQCTLPYKKKDYLLSIAERSFFEVLSLTVKDLGYSVFVKVRLGDLLYLPGQVEGRMAFLSRIQSKHVDFLICSAKELHPLLVLELDDSSHNRSDRQVRDRFVDQALHDAGLPILHIPAKVAYNVHDLELQIKEALNPKGENTAAG